MCLKAPKKKVCFIKISDWLVLCLTPLDIPSAVYEIIYSNYRKTNLSFISFLPVVVPEFDMSARLQDLPILQPGELRLRLPLGLTGEDGCGANRASDGLWSLNELCRSWERKKTGIGSTGHLKQRIRAEWRRLGPEAPENLRRNKWREEKYDGLQVIPVATIY